MKKQSKKRVIAFLLSTLLLVSLFQNVTYYPFAGNDQTAGAGAEQNTQLTEHATDTDGTPEAYEEASQAIAQQETYAESSNRMEEPAPRPFMDIVDFISISPTGSASSPISMSQMFKVMMKFTLPTDSELLLSENYIYSFDLGAVAVEGGTPYESVYALIAASNTATPQPIVMGDEQVGTYTIINGIVTLNFYEGIGTLSSPDASRNGEFRFDCGLDEDKLQDEGGEYTLKFSTKPGVDNPKVVLSEKNTIDAGVEVEKSDAVFDSSAMTATYTITLTNKNANPVTNVVVKDAMGYNLSFDNTQPVHVDNGTSVVAAQDPNNNGYTFSIASLPSGDTKITYVCKVDPSTMISANNASGSQNGLDNTINATKDGKPIYLDTNKSVYQTTRFTVYKDAVSKSSSVSSDKTNITWTIVINSGSTPFDMKDCVFQDTLDSLLTIKEGSVQVASSGGAADSAVINGLKNAITNGTAYTFPEGSTGEYTITYETTVPEHAGLQSYKNTAKVTDPYNNTDTAQKSTEPIGSKISSKSYNGSEDHNDKTAIPAKDANGDLILDWKTVVTVPQGAASFKYRDYIYNRVWENGLGFVQDSVALSAVDKNGTNIALIAGTDYIAPSFTQNGEELNMNFELTAAGLAKVNQDGGTVVSITYQTIGRYHDREVNDYQSYNNHYEIEVGDNRENGDASIEKYYKDDSSTGGIEKTVVSVDPKTHTITWKVVVDPGTTPIQDLVLSDVISDMKYYGYNLDMNSYIHNQDSTDRKLAIVRVLSDYSIYEVEMKETAVDTTDPDHPKYTYQIQFSDDMYMNRLSTYGDFINNKNNIDKKLEIYYTTQVTGSYLLYNNYGTNYTNTVTATGKQGTAQDIEIGGSSASKTLDTEILTKQLDTPNNGVTSELQYSIRVNPDALDLNPDKDYYVIDDELPSSLVFNTKKTIIKDAQGNTYSYVASADTVKDAPAGSHIYHVSYNNNIISFTVPDKVALTITYAVNMLMDATSGSKQFINSVKVEQPYVKNSSQSSSSEYRNINSSSATIYSALFNVEKVNAQDISERLGGAGFTATEYEYQQATNSWVATGKTYTATTVAGELLKSTEFVDADGNQPKENHIYEIEETTAPVGFELTSTKYKIIILKDDAQYSAEQWAQRLNGMDDVYRIMGNTTLVFADMPSATIPSNELTITKQYVKADGTTIVDTLPAVKAEICIYNQNLTLAQCSSGSYTPLSVGQVDTFNYTDQYDTANGHVITLKNIPAGTYTVYEKTAPNGYDILTRVYHFTVEDYKISWENGTADFEVDAAITNKQTFDNKFTINKSYYKASDSVNELANSAVPELASFTYQQTAYWNGTAYVAMNGAVKDVPSVTGKNGFEFELKKLPAGKYIVREKESAVYEDNPLLPYSLEVAADGKITVSNATGLGLPISSTTVSVDVKNIIHDNKFTIHKNYYNTAGTKLTNSSQFSAGTDQQTVEFILQKKNGNTYEAATTADYESYEDTTSDVQLGDDYVWSNLEPGEYKVVENKKTGDTTIYEPVSDVYFTVGADYKITIGNTAAEYTKEAAVDNRELTGNAFRFYVSKQLSNQSGNLTLADSASGIVFELTKEGDPAFSGGLSYNATTKRWESDNLGAGTYRLSETDTKAGYKLAGVLKFEVGADKKLVDNSITYSGSVLDYDVTVEPGALETVIFTLINRPNENSITVNKKYYQADNSSFIAQAPANPAEFTLYSVNATGVQTGVATLPATNGSCKFSKLEAGKYVIKETYTPAGYTTCEDIEFEVNADYTINITDPAAGASYPDETTFKVVTDNAYAVIAEAANRITNKFTLTKKFAYIDGTVVTNASELVTLMNAVTFLLNDENGNDITHMLVKQNNEITISNLKDGVYTLTETAAPQGYNKAASSIELTVANGVINASYAGSVLDFTDLYNNNTTDVKASLYNRQKENQLVVKKEYYTADDTLLAISQITNKAGFVVKDSSGAVFTNYVFNPAAGTYTFKNFVPGTYTIKENVPVGFDGVSEVTFTVSANGTITFGTANAGWTTVENDGTMQVTATAKNTRKANKLTLTKRYLDVNGNEKTGVVGASFAVKQNGTTVKDMTFNSGVYTVENLNPGSYEIVETVPAGYMQPIGRIMVTVAQDGKISAAYDGGNADDFRITNSGSLVNASIEFKNHEITNMITINKSYETATGDSIAYSDLTDVEYASFRLFKVMGSSRSEITDTQKLQFNKQNGVYVFYNLEPGYYEITEEAGEGFEDTNMVIAFRVSDNKMITNITGATPNNTSTDYDKQFDVKNTREQFDNKLVLTKLFINQGNQEVTGADYDSLLANVSFTMKKGGRDVSTFTYDRAAKQWVVQHLEPGVYTIEETNNNLNYNAAGSITVTVTKTAPGKTSITAQYNGTNSEDLVVTQDNANLANIELSVKNHQIVENCFTIKKRFVDAFGTEITDAAKVQAYTANTKFYYQVLGQTDKTEIPFDATTKLYKLENLQTGTYVVTETPDKDFVKAGEIKLVVAADGKLTVTYDGDSTDVTITEDQTATNKTDVVLYNHHNKGSVNITKHDLTNATELPGAKLTIKDADGNVIVEPWVSASSPRKLSLDTFEPNKIYILTEITAPFGYEVAESIQFKLDNYGKVYVVDADNQEKAVDANTIVMNDAPTYATFSKVDATNGEELPGAKLEIKDEQGNLIDSWISTNEKHQILMNKFKPDVVYSMTEITAPKGYEVAETIFFRFDADGKVYVKTEDNTFIPIEDGVLVMKDSPTTQVTPPTPTQPTPDTPTNTQTNTSVKTGDAVPVKVIFMIAIFAFVGIIILQSRKKKETNYM